MNPSLSAQLGYEHYYEMLCDDVRTNAYRSAIARQVKPGDIVCDLGAGTGVLGMWALKAGASKVYAIEKTDAIQLAEALAQKNGLSDKIVFINDNSLNVELPEKVDVLLSETLGSFAIDENTLEFTIDARDRFLKKEGCLIPERLELFASAVDAPDAYKKIDQWNHIPDLDFSPAFELFSSKIMVETFKADSMLSEAIQMADIDLRTLRDKRFEGRNYFPIDRPGTISGISAWFRAHLDAETVIDTSPKRSSTHWKQAFFPFKETINVIKGDILDWAVSVGCKEEASDDTIINYEYRCTQRAKNNTPPNSKAGRNDPCPCGSGKKFKKCCGSAA